MPSSKECLALNKMLDIPSDPASLDESIRQELQLLIKEAGCSGGALFFYKSKQNEDFNWLTENIPIDWEDRIHTKDSNIFQATLEITSSGNSIPAFPTINLTGGIPLSINAKIYGGVLFYDPAEKTLPLDQLVLIARPLTFLISRSQANGNSQDVFNSSNLDLIVAIQDISLGVQEIQHRVSEGIHKLIAPDGILLFLYYPEKNRLIEKKRLDLTTNRTDQFTLTLKPSLVEACIREKKFQFVRDLSSNSLFNPEVDGMAEIEFNSVLCIPMEAGGIMVGAIELVFSQSPALTPFQMHILNAIATSFANGIISTRLVQQLRVASADIEANRWEVIRSRNTLRALFDSLPASIYIIDQTYKIIAINISRSNRIESHPAQLVGKKCYEVLYNRNEACAGCLINDTLFTGNGTVRNNQIWVDGEPVDWEITTYSILNDKNQPSQAILIEQDITEKRRLEAHVVQAEKLAAVGQLAAGVAHEINNPLAAIIANAQILKRDLANDEDNLESAKLIELAGIRAAQVVKNLLGLARKDQYKFEPTNLNETIYAALRLVQHELISRSVTVKKDLSEDMPLILASRDHLQGVWINLIMNALDAMDGQNGHLQVTTRSLNNEFRIVISDNGQGIPPERISRIFEPFYTTKNLGRGTGLGLSMCHRTIKNHGGYIIVDSQIGVGTQFTVVLPGNTGTSQPKPQGG